MTGSFEPQSGPGTATTPGVKSRRAKASYLAEALMLLLGTVCLGWYGYNWIASSVDQLWSNYSLNAELSGDKPSLKGFIVHVVHGGGQTSEPADRQERTGQERAGQESAEGAAVQNRAESQEQPSWPAQLPQGEDIGRIEIPRLHISSIVRQGVDDRTLSRAVGHVPQTALPGQLGNVGLAAHRDTYFRNLRGVREGDVIRVVTTRGTFEYAVESLKVVNPTNVEVLDPTDHRSLTLVTCYPFNYIGHAPKRFIVRARQIQAALSAPSRG